VQLFKFVLSVPHSKAALAQSLLDSAEIPFHEELDHVAKTSDGLPGRALILYAEPHQRENWEGLIATHGLARYLVVSPFDYDPGEWVEKWKAYYEWVRVSDRLAVGPDFKPCPFEVPAAIQIKPGQSFGTGVHESTRLALTLLEEFMPAEATLLDAGCGTGILAIAAARIGARSCLAFDIELDAVQETVMNAAANGAKVESFCGGIEAVGGTFDVVVANMLGYRLQAISQGLLGAVAPGGRLILAGLVVKEMPTFEETFFANGAGFGKLRQLQLNEWWAAAWQREEM
jgi:ribosomal protein L11 methyltransferase